MYRRHTLADFPQGTDVRVSAWGIGARLSDVGRTGEVVGLGRTRVKVQLRQGNGFPAEVRSFDPNEIRRTTPRRPLAN
jgi:hypothetical protein